MISFAQKTFSNGTLTSKLHVIELGAAPGAQLGPHLHKQLLLISPSPCNMAAPLTCTLHASDLRTAQLACGGGEDAGNGKPCPAVAHVRLSGQRARVDYKQQRGSRC